MAAVSAPPGKLKGGGLHGMNPRSGAESQVLESPKVEIAIPPSGRGLPSQLSPQYAQTVQFEIAVPHLAGAPGATE
jgi:hypothetical protein